MHKIDTLDIKAFVAHSIKDVFATMFSMDVSLFNGQQPAVDKGWARKENLGFQHQVHTAMVEIYLKPGE